jgi:hypothetical protein
MLHQRTGAPAIGNDLYGTWARFSDRRRQAGHDRTLTPRQWRALGRVTGLADRLAMVGEMMESISHRPLRARDAPPRWSHGGAPARRW